MREPWYSKSLRKCRKQKHAQEAKAEAHRRSLARKHGVPVEHFKTYYCAKCHAWHVAHAKPKGGAT